MLVTRSPPLPAFDTPLGFKLPLQIRSVNINPLGCILNFLANPAPCNRLSRIGITKLSEGDDMHRRVFLLIAAVAVSGIFTGCKKQDAGTKPAKEEISSQRIDTLRLPDPLAGALLASNPIELMAQAEKLGAKTAPVPAGSLNMALVMGLQQLGMKDTRAINLQAPIGILLLGNDKQHGLIGSIGIQSQEKLLESLSPVWKSKSAENSIHELVREEVDTYDVFKGGKNKPGKKSFSLFARFASDRIFVSTDRQALEQHHATLANMLSTHTPANGLIGLVMLNHLRAQYKQQLDALPILVDQFMTKDTSFAKAIPNLEKMSWLISWLGKKCHAAIQQIERISFGLTINDQAAELSFGFHAENNSFFKKLLSSQQDRKLNLAHTLPPDHFMASGLDIQWDLIKDDLLSFTQELFQKSFGITLSDDLSAAFSEMIQSMGDEFAFSENITSEGISLVEVIALKDGPRYEKAFEKSMPLVMELLKQMDVGVKAEEADQEIFKTIAEHDGVRLKALNWKLDLTSMPALQAQMMKKMYGEKIQMVYAVFDQRLALAIGKHSETEMKALIDRTRKKTQGIYDSKPFQHAAGNWLDTKNSGFVFVSLSKMIEMGMQAALGASGQTKDDNTSQTLKSGLFITTKSKPDVLRITHRVPAAHLEEIGALIRKMTSAGGM